MFQGYRTADWSNCPLPYVRVRRVNNMNNGLIIGHRAPAFDTTPRLVRGR